MEMCPLFTPSSETQGQSVGSEEEAWQKFSGFFPPSPNDLPCVSWKIDVLTPVPHKSKFQFLAYSLEISDPFNSKWC